MRASRNSKAGAAVTPTPNSGEDSGPIAWWSIETESNIQEESKHILSRGRIMLSGWTYPPFTLLGSCASTQADIRQPNHPQYDVRINCYGWASCTCQFFNTNRGACKHLWAFRKLLTRSQIQYQIVYPTTIEEARHIFSKLQDYCIFPFIIKIYVILMICINR